ncbi:GNAT family N-acetyltransferase [Granulicella sp. WH15]|uniref:GNAT family N-acetyltransferase n=1 Tax=Granulicella sp. WH15 TaxID=2602070 RepID=UPI0013671BCA|nr:GNAT family N-acetyltransferase [Granulicella sp. WH15]QHN03346.1 GNAT family N-acetyltransferase [Granulicella sp. WH15]
MNENERKELPIRALSTFAELERCVELQLETWGYSSGDVIPRKMFIVANRIGGQVLGAFDGDTIVGFLMAIPGIRNGVPYLHSHMLAVLPEYRNYGLGRRMKLAQREDALARGIRLIEWTFDPLEIRNAHLNITRLGAIVRRYQPDFYGPSSSPLQGGLPTDRLYAEWWLGSERVQRVLRGESAKAEMVEQVNVPVDVYEWKQNPEQRALALKVQTRNREALQSGFARGLAVVGYEVDAERNGTFVLGTAADPDLKF